MRDLIAVILQMLVNYLIMTYRPIYMGLDVCAVATILLPLKDFTLNVDWYSYQPFQYKLIKNLT